MNSSELIQLRDAGRLREPSAFRRELEARLSNYLNAIPDAERIDLVREATRALRHAGKSMTDINVFVETYRLAEPKYGELPAERRSGGGNYRLTVMPFGKHRGQQLCDLPITYVYWLRAISVGEPLYSALGDELERRARKSRRRSATLHKDAAAA